MSRGETLAGLYRHAHDGRKSPAGIDLALWLADEIHGRAWAEAIQLVIEYDPHPPVDAGHMSKALPETRKLAKELMDRSIPADQRRLVPRIAWRRFIDLIRTGK